MLWLPQSGRVTTVSNIGIIGAISTGGFGTLVPAHATTTLLDGDVTELISAASNTQDSWGISITIRETGLSNTASEACMDILIGGATDDVLIPALICGYGGGLAAGTTYFFPLHIPAGLRIAASLASVRTAINAQVLCTLYGGGHPPFKVGRKVTTYGTQINNARGLAVVPSQSGAAASATEMTASTTEHHFAFMAGFQASDSTLNTGVVMIGIGVGASTEDRIGTWPIIKSSTEEMGGLGFPLPAFCNVPAGSRLTFLASNSGSNDASYDGLIYAVS